MIKSIFGLMTLLPAITLANTPDIVGTWKGETVASVYGSGGHHPADLGGSVTYRTIETTYIIENQKGRNFSGKFMSPSATEMFVGTFSRDNRTGIMVDLDGQFRFDLYAPNKMEVCYGHPLGSGGHAVAACVELERQ